MNTKKIVQLGVYGLAVVLCLVAVIWPTRAGILISLVLLALGIGAAIVFPLMYLAKNPASGKKLLIGLGVMLAIFLVCFAVASNEEVYGAKEGVMQLLAGAQLARWVEAGVIAMVVMLALAVVVFIAAEVWNTTR